MVPGRGVTTIADAVINQQPGTETAAPPAAPTTRSVWLKEFCDLN